MTADRASLLERMLRIPSLSGQEGELASFLARSMLERGFDRSHVDEAGNVVGVRAAQGPVTRRLVLLGVAVAQQHFGNAGLFTVAAISGLTDMDAITLSTADLVKSGHLDASIGWRVVLTGAAANLVFKGILAAMLGTRQLAGIVAVAFAASLVGAGLIGWLWPA